MPPLPSQTGRHKVFSKLQAANKEHSSTPVLFQHHMPRQLQLQRSGSVATEPPPGIPGHGQFPISSFPLEKYSFSVIHASEPSISSQWTHYAHRDNLYFVVDTSSVPRPAPCTLLKVVWGSQTLVRLLCPKLSPVLYMPSINMALTQTISPRNVSISPPSPIRNSQQQTYSSLLNQLSIQSLARHV